MATPEELKDKFWNSLHAQRTVMLGLEGVQEDHMRPMTALFEEQDCAPSGSSRPWTTHWSRPRPMRDRAIATFAAKGHDLFATVHGQLTQEHDRSVVDRFWSPFVAAWYEGKDDPKLAVLRLDPERAQIWLNDAGLFTGVGILLGADPRKAYEGKVAQVALDR